MTCTCAYHDQLIEIRRHLHTMPEEGWSEFTTTAFIVGKLREYGYEVLLRQESHQSRQLPRPQPQGLLKPASSSPARTA